MSDVHGGGGGAAAIKVLKSDSITANGTEQTIFDQTFTKPTNISGWINVYPLETDDALYVYVYTTVGGEERLHAVEVYQDSQSTNQCFFEKRIVKGRYRVTIKQTATVMRTFKYEFYEG